MIAHLLWTLGAGVFAAPPAERAAPSAEPVEFQVIAFNCWGLPFPFSPGRRGARLAEASAVFDHEAADIIGLEELFGRSRQLWPRGDRALLPVDDAATGLALLSRWPVQIEQVQRYDPDRPHDHFTHKGFVQATVTPPGAVPIQVFVTHFDAAGAYERRVQEAIRLVEEVDKVPGPVVIMGDFNLSDKGTDLHIDALFTQAHWRDLGVDAGRTHRMFDERFDRIYLRDGPDWCLESKGFQVLGPDMGARDGLSDHHPVRARLALRRCDADS